MLKLLRTSIIYRSTFIVLGIALLVGSFFAVFTYYWTSHLEQEQAKNRMGNLLSTVESTTSIACYLLDTNLAAEVSRGLLKNEDVNSIRIFTPASVLAQASKSSKTAAASTAAALSIPSSDISTMRDVFSPFNATEKVCQIELIPDMAFIQKQVNSKANFTTYLLILQTILMALALVFVVIKVIVRPIKTISDRLHDLSPEAGARLGLPLGNEQDEIGQLVRDVNTIVGKLVNILEDERHLRIKHEIGEKKFRTIFDNAETGIFLLKTSGEVTSYNSAFLRLLALSPESTADNISSGLISALEGQELRLHMMIDTATNQDQILSEDFSIEIGTPPVRKWLHIVLSPIEDGVLQGLLNDITDHKIGEEAANQLAVTDHLTGAFNRLGFDNEVASLKRVIQKTGSGFFLLLIDLDGFKSVNDTYGHDAGDKILCNFTQILFKIVRRSDFVARLGGDEFVVLLKDLKDADKAKEIAWKIITLASAPVDTDNGTQAEIGASIGITYVDYADFDKNDVIRQADDAMYEVKKSGKNNYRLYDPASKR